jgi:hydrogenase maturation protease
VNTKRQSPALEADPEARNARVSSVRSGLLVPPKLDPEPFLGLGSTIPQPNSNRGAAETKILLLGLGNELLTDDAIGLRVAREVRRHFADDQTILVAETCEMGLALLDLIVGFETLILVDAIRTNGAPAGSIHELDGNDVKTLPAVSPHFLGVGELLALGHELGLSIPTHVKIFAVEVQDPFTVGTQLTPELDEALPVIVERVLSFCESATLSTARARKRPMILRTSN